MEGRLLIVLDSEGHVTGTCGPVRPDEPDAPGAVNWYMTHHDPAAIFVIGPRGQFEAAAILATLSKK